MILPDPAEHSALSDAKKLDATAEYCEAMARGVRQGIAAVISFNGLHSAGRRLYVEAAFWSAAAGFLRDAATKARDSAGSYSEKEQWKARANIAHGQLVARFFGGLLAVRGNDATAAEDQP